MAIYCEEYTATDQPWCDNLTVETPWGSERRRCQACVTIKGVIQALNALVFREPYLVTEGMAGAPRKEAWEAEDEEGGEDEEETHEASDGEELDGFTREVRARVRAEAEAAVMKRWGLLRAEQAEAAGGEEEEEQREVEEDDEEEEEAVEREEPAGLEE